MLSLRLIEVGRSLIMDRDSWLLIPYLTFFSTVNHSNGTRRLLQLPCVSQLKLFTSLKHSLKAVQDALVFGFLKMVKYLPAYASSKLLIEKVGFVGIQGQRWVVSHGCSLNLRQQSCIGFKAIDPCGLGGNVSIVSCEERSGLAVRRVQFEETFIQELQNKFNCKIVE